MDKGVTLVLLLIVLLAACGGSGGDTSEVDGTGDNGLDESGMDAGGRAVGTLTPFEPAKAVIGQADFQSRGHPGSLSATTVVLPGHLAAGSLWMQQGSRVVRFATPVSTNLPAANLVVGQLDFTESVVGQGANRFRAPAGMAQGGGKFAVTDPGNQRVLVWNRVPTANGSAADVVIGQPDFLGNLGGTSDTQMRLPIDCALASDKLIVCDRGNHRVLIWDMVPAANGQPASLAVGQAGFSTSTPATTASGLNDPTGVWSDGTRLAVADRGNNRILIWTSMPTTFGQAANVVLGQADFSGSAAGAGRMGLNAPFDVDFDGAVFVVSDTGNHRVLVWDGFPTQSGQPADLVLGQSTFDHTAHDDDDQDGVPDAAPGPGVFSATGPAGLSLRDGQLFVSDTGNHRILVFE